MVASKHDIAVVGGGPSGLTAATLLARAGHPVRLFERGEEIGGLWASRRDPDGYFETDNSCKVYQPTYQTVPALLRTMGTGWESCFTPRHDLARDWLRPFLADCSLRDLTRLALAFVRHTTGLRDYRAVSVAEFLEEEGMGDACRRWMRATALGGVTGTLRMSMWELFHRFRGNLRAILPGAEDRLYWNASPQNAAGGFLDRWAEELGRLGVRVHVRTEVSALSRGPGGIELQTSAGVETAAAVFLATPPPALLRLLVASSDDIAGGFGLSRERLGVVLGESVYEHLGLSWFFDRPLGDGLPLGGHNVRRGWHPILVEHPQYRPHLPPPAQTVVVGSISMSTDFPHPRLGTRPRDHSPEALARILWEDERAMDPRLPEPIGWHSHGVSSATQIVRHGPLPVRAATAPVYVATSLNGLAPYFTASLESAVQAGAAAAAAFDPGVERLPMGEDGGQTWAARR